MKNPDEHKFHSLPGVKGGIVKGTMASSINGFMTALEKYRAVSDAGDHGSVIVYRDDAGNFRCHFMQWQQSKDAQTFKTKKAMREWLKEWMPKQRQSAAA